jgi:long-chain acyl-CoA synthetase
MSVPKGYQDGLTPLPTADAWAALLASCFDFGVHLWAMEATLFEQVQQSRSFGDRIFCHHRTAFRAFQWTYNQLLDYVDRMATHLHHRRIAPGDRVMLWGPNGPEWVIAYLGCIRAGVIVVPLDVRQTEEFAARVAEETEARLLLRSRVIPEAKMERPQVVLENLISSLDDIEPDPPTGTRPAPDDLVEIMYTSGTTSDPKGVMITHRNIASNVTALLDAILLDRPYTFLSLLPLSHLYEQTCGFWIPFSRGDKIVYLQQVKPSTIEEAFRQESIDMVMAVPRLLQLLKDGFLRKLPVSEAFMNRLLELTSDLPRDMRKLLYFPLHHFIGWNFEFFLLGGAPLPPELHVFWERLGFVVLQGYGLTETGPVITANRRELLKVGSVGKALPGVELRISEEGEALTRGPHVTPGYYRRPKATEECFAGGWFRTGDLGRVDEDGFLFLQGRLKELIVTEAGVNVYPIDIEQVLDSFDGVREGCVVDFNGRVHAVLLLDEAAKARAEAIITQANQRLDDAQRIRGFTIWPDEDFPRTTTLKVRKGEVLKKLQSMQDGRGVLVGPTVTTDDDLMMLVARIADVSPSAIKPDSRLGDDLGLTSIDRVELLSAIEWAKRLDLGDVDLTSEMTVSELRQLVERKERSAPKRRFPRWARWPVVNAVRQLLQLLLLFPVFHLFTRFKVEGRDRLPEPGAEPYVFIANHTSHADTAAVLRALPRPFRRRLAIAAWDEFFHRPGNRWLTWLLSRVLYPFLVIGFNIYLIPQLRSPRLSLQYTGELLDHGWHILIYPEGERRPTDQMGRFQEGIGLVVAEMRATVIPIKLEGLDSVLPRGRAWPWFGKARLIFGEPIPPMTSDYADIAARLEDAVRTL